MVLVSPMRGTNQPDRGQVAPAGAPSRNREPWLGAVIAAARAGLTGLFAVLVAVAGLLVAVVVGSGIAAQQLSPDDIGLQLLENSTATVFGLTVLILWFGPASGAP